MGNSKEYCRILHLAEEHKARSKSRGNFKDMSKMQSNGGTLELALNSSGLDVGGSVARVAGCSAWSNINSINGWFIYPGFWMGHVIHTRHWAVRATPLVCLKVIRVWLYKLQTGQLRCCYRPRLKGGWGVGWCCLCLHSCHVALMSHSDCPARDTLQHVVSGPLIMRL